jgi:hypothetical protein
MIQSLLLFVSMSFGLFGIVNSHHTDIYKNAYDFWLDYNVFARKEHLLNNPETCNPNLYPCDTFIKKTELCNKNICSKAESFVRQMCRMNDINLIVLVTFYLISVITCLVILYHIETVLKVYDFSELTKYNVDERLDLVESVIAFILTCVMIGAAYYLSKYNNYLKKTGSIDDKIFQIWWKHKCHRHKNEELVEKRQPMRLYEILAEEIYMGRITDATTEEKELVDNLFPNLNLLSNQKVKI